jgi:hypothetical protein
VTDRSRVGRKSKGKGKRGEYWLRDRLREAFGIPFERTPQSGGSELKAGWKLAGDICAPPGYDWNYSLEMKWRENWELGQLFSKKCVIWDWMNQACHDAKLTNMVPILVFKRNNVAPLVMVPYYYSDVGHAFILKNTRDSSICFTVWNEGKEYEVMLFEDWLTHLKKERAREA